MRVPTLFACALLAACGDAVIADRPLDGKVTAEILSSPVVRDAPIKVRLTNGLDREVEFGALSCALVLERKTGDAWAALPSPTNCPIPRVILGPGMRFPGSAQPADLPGRYRFTGSVQVYGGGTAPITSSEFDVP